MMENYSRVNVKAFFGKKKKKSISNVYLNYYYQANIICILAI